MKRGLFIALCGRGTAFAVGLVGLSVLQLATGNPAHRRRTECAEGKLARRGSTPGAESVHFCGQNVCLFHRTRQFYPC
jgi:hypothetical protein